MRYRVVYLKMQIDTRWQSKHIRYRSVSKSCLNIINRINVGLVSEVCYTPRWGRHKVYLNEYVLLESVSTERGEIKVYCSIVVRIYSANFPTVQQAIAIGIKVTRAFQ